MSGPEPDNLLQVAGWIVRPADIRFSPAGIALARLTLEHRSHQTEADLSREAAFRIQVVAAGAALAQQAQQLQAGQGVRISGFLTRANYRDGDNRLTLHAQQIETLDELSRTDGT